MPVIEPVEILYLTFMDRWQRTAPPDQHEGELNGKRARNTQTERLALVLRNIAAGRHAEHIYSTLARYSRRKDGKSYVSKDASWMQQSHSLSDGWYFEGCTSLVQKQAVLHNLGRVGLSGAFCQAAEDFVENIPIGDHFPTEADEPAVLAKIRAWEEKHKDEE